MYSNFNRKIICYVVLIILGEFGKRCSDGGGDGGGDEPRGVGRRNKF